MFGWCGKILRIDLTLSRYQIERPDQNVLEKFIGGRGLAGFYLSDSIRLDWDHPDMPLLLFAGPLVNTHSPTSGRMSVMSRSPLTATIGDCSVGGKFGTFLKRAGFDGIIITGRSKDLVGIEIENEAVRIVSAGHLKDKEIDQVQSHLTGKGATAVIGPAAEHGVLFSNVIVDEHFAAGRNGLGLSFANKNIKYITVAGNAKTLVFDPDGLKHANEDIFRQVSASPILSGKFGISHYGTGALYDLMSARKMMPTDNFRKSFFDQAQAMNAHAYRQQYNPKRTGCMGCHIRCKKKSSQGHPLPEFETMSHFSALIGNNDIQTVFQANQRCNQLGMDTISTAATIACYAEINNCKLLPQDILDLIDNIGRQQGIGKELGVGSARYARSKDRQESSMSVKKQEMPAYDPRGALGMALAYVTSTRGACHLRAYPIAYEILRKPVPTDRFSFMGKARMIKISEDLNAVVDSLTACKFIFLATTLEEFAKVYKAVTGIDVSGQDLLKTGERIYYHECMMNAENGFDSSDDDLPQRFFKDLGYKGEEMEIKPIDRNDFLKARDSYYKVRGLDKNGRPMAEKAVELGLGR